MAFLDFIRNREGQRPAGEQQSQQEQPETAKQMYTRQAAEEQANAKPVDRDMKPEQRAVMSDVQTKMRSSAEQPSETAAPSSAPADATANPQPMRQNMMNQDKAAPESSPTSAQSGATVKEVEGPSAPAETPSKTQ
jgi:hypothetical protein